MKARFVLWLAVAACCLSSCKWQSVDNRTPEMAVTNFRCHHPGVAKVDTLYGRSTKDGFVMDTITVGDTVSCFAILNSFNNNLVSYRAKWDTAAYSVRIVTDSIKVSLDEAGSYPDQGSLVFKPGYCIAVVPFIYVARKAGSHTFEMTVASDCGISDMSLNFTQPVAALPEED